MRNWWLAVWLLVAVVPATAKAHFLWLLTKTDSSQPRVEVYFAETAEPDDPALLERVKSAQVWATGGRGEPKKLELSPGKDCLQAALDGALPQALVLTHSYGVVAKGGEPFLLHYYAKTYPYNLPGSWRPVQDNNRLPLEISPQMGADGLTLSVTWKGQPAAEVSLAVVGPGAGGVQEGATDKQGKFRCDLSGAGVYAIRARLIEEQAGQLDGKEYKTVRHYSTLSLDVMPQRLTPVAHQLPPLPQGVTSFGGAVLGHTLFLYGGNYGSAHQYSQAEQSGDLWHLDLKQPGKWQKISGGPRLQGLAMVGYQDALYRVGGFSALNQQGQEEQLESQAEFARLRAGSSTWEALPNLPQPRSSHDAALVGSVLYVAGGWNLQGGGRDAVWHDSLLSIDLAADKPVWQTAATAPFKRRALSLAAHQGKLYCLGGMQEQGGPTTRVDIFDPQTKQWSLGASLPGGGMEGFGNSSFASGGSLYATTISGAIVRLSDDGQRWDYLGQLAQPRFFHRLLPWGEHRLVAVGGASMMTGKAEQLELLSLEAASAPKSAPVTGK